MNKKDFQESMECRGDMKHQALIWSMVKEVSKLFNENMVSYDEFLEIVSLIDHYTHHEAELHQYQNEMKYKHDHDIDFREELDYEEIESEDLEWIIVDIDECDGDFLIPAI